MHQAVAGSRIGRLGQVNATAQELAALEQDNVIRSDPLSAASRDGPGRPL